jgi:mannosyltransferase
MFQMSFKSHSQMLRALWFLAVAAGCLFAFKTLAAIPLTSLWNDELRTVEKSFQPSLGFLYGYLRRDVHPPLYYSLLWGAGKLFGETVIVLRSFSWLCYLVGAGSLALACWAWGRSQAAVAVAALLALALPFTVRFAVEGKAYALLYGLISLAVLFRLRLIRGDSTAAIPYGLFWSAAALTHYYGVGLLLCQAALDVWRRRPTARPLAWALLLPTAWMLANLSYLLGSGGRAWISPASPLLLLKVLRIALGAHWPVVLLACGVLALLFWRQPTSRLEAASVLVKDWGVDAGLLLFVGTFAVSLLKPSAVDRYYIVLVPAFIGAFSCWLGLQIRDSGVGPWRRGLVAVIFAAILVLFWHDSYRAIAPLARMDGHRKGNDFRSLSLMAAYSPFKYSSQCRQLNAYDHLLIQENLSRPLAPWGCLPLRGRSVDPAFADQFPRLPGKLVALAVTGRKTSAETVLGPFRQALEARGFECALDQHSTRSASVFNCRAPDQQ